ncbi:unnamed protein product [Taenia asiatica]|uniref:RPN2_C domain-containing protein n=1 Tax=Taenia asiatica TaxID=60517 RepID=A0A0R3VYS7_TAEAS|nr:unnamed protein product [Taenia asiatica]
MLGTCSLLSATNAGFYFHNIIVPLVHLIYLFRNDCFKPQDQAEKERTSGQSLPPMLIPLLHLGADTPVYLATLPKGTTEPYGHFVSERQIVDVDQEFPPLGQSNPVKKSQS